MTTGSGRGFLLAAAIVTMTGGAFASPVISQEADTDYAKIAVPGTGCELVNNVWDRKATPEGFKQSVFLAKRGGETLPGWRWNAPGKRTTVLGMPEIICGDKPWDAPQGLRSEFPFHPGEKQLTASFDIDLSATGRYNMAFSLWAVSRLPAVKQTITHEIMIWNVDGGVPPIGKKIGSLEAAGTVFDIYFDPKQGVITGPDPFTWTVVSFVARTPLLKGSIDFSPFINDLLARKILTGDLYLTNLELGDEVSDGTGSVEIRKLELGVR